MIPKNQRTMTLCVALLGCNLLFIWGNSLLPASVSGSLSQWLRDLLGSVLGDAAGQGDGFLRKMAHFAEFCSLGILLSWLFAMRRKKTLLLPAAVWGGIAACIDEMLQHFAPGRAPRLTDVILDTAGVLAGIGIFWLGYYTVKKRQ